MTTSNPGMSTSPNPTPELEHASMLHTPAASADTSLVEDTLDPGQFIDTESLKSTDVRADPILASLAKQQARASSATPTAQAPLTFKARPAPSSFKMEGVGPRMTKSAALRQGLKWESERPRTATTNGSEKETGFKNVPGHKRGMSLVSDSLGSFS